MRIAIIGGHGKVALLAAPLLVADGHAVAGVIRDPDQADEVSATGATPVVADVEALDVAGLAEVLDGHEAVVWAAGAGGGDPSRTYAVDRDAAIRSMEAAARAGIDRYVMVSYFGAGPDHGVPEDSSFFPYAEAKAAADEHLRGTELAWTILGPSRLTDEPGTGAIESGPGVTGSSVSREDVARTIAAVLAEPGTAGATIAFNGGATPIAEVVARVAGEDR